MERIITSPTKIPDHRDEMLDVVDEHDVVLYSATKDHVYDNGLRKRIANVVIIDPVTKKLALQRRGKNVYWQPDHYAVSACGHVAAGETMEEGAKRELFEEMGIDAALHHVSTKAFTCEFDRPFILGTYVAYAPHDAIKSNAREVGTVLLLDKTEVESILAKGEKLQNIFAPVMRDVLDFIA